MRLCIYKRGTKSFLNFGEGNKNEIIAIEKRLHGCVIVIVTDLIEPFLALTLSAMHFSIAHFETQLEIGFIKEIGTILEKIKYDENTI